VGPVGTSRPARTTNSNVVTGLGAQAEGSASGQQGGEQVVVGFTNDPGARGEVAPLATVFGKEHLLVVEARTTWMTHPRLAYR